MPSSCYDDDEVFWQRLYSSLISWCAGYYCRTVVFRRLKTAKIKFTWCVFTIFFQIHIPFAVISFASNSKFCQIVADIGSINLTNFSTCFLADSCNLIPLCADRAGRTLVFTRPNPDLMALYIVTYETSLPSKDLLLLLARYMLHCLQRIFQNDQVQHHHVCFINIFSLTLSC